MNQLLKLLLSESSKGKARNANRGALLALCVFIALRQNSQDSRLARIEGALGITNAPVTIQLPFTAAASTNHFANIK